MMQQVTPTKMSGLRPWQVGNGSDGEHVFDSPRPLQIGEDFDSSSDSGIDDEPPWKIGFRSIGWWDTTKVPNPKADSPSYDNSQEFLDALKEHDLTKLNMDEDQAKAHLAAYLHICRGHSAPESTLLSDLRLLETPKRIIDAGFELRRHQKEGVGRLRSLEDGPVAGGILGDDMGLGKTLQIIALIIVGIEDGKKGPTLIVTPKSLVPMWTDATSKYAKPALNCYVYHGSDRTIKERELMKYEVVIATYKDVLREYKEYAMVLEAHLAWWERRRLSKETGTLEQVHDPRPQRANMKLLSIYWQRVVPDETHRIRNDATKINKALCSLSTKHRIVSTGTPIQNEYTDVGGIFKWLELYPWNNTTFFEEMFVLPAKDSNRMNENEILKGRRNAILALTLNGICIRRRKGDLFDGTKPMGDLRLEQHTITVCLDNSGVIGDLSGETEQSLQEHTREQWDEAARAAKLGARKRRNSEDEDEDEDEEFENPRGTILKLITKARMEASHWATPQAGYDAPNDDDDVNNPRPPKRKGGEAKRRREFINRMSQDNNWKSTKIIKAVEIIEKYPESKFLVFCQFKSVLDAVSVALEKHGVHPVMYTGDMSSRRKEEAIATFSSKECDVMLLTSKAGGEGLNLQMADRVIILCPEWNPEMESQCIGRANRMGQKKVVHVYRILAAKSMDLRVVAVQERKIAKREGLLGNREWVNSMKGWPLERFSERLRDCFIDCAAGVATRRIRRNSNTTSSSLGGNAEDAVLSSEHGDSTDDDDDELENGSDDEHLRSRERKQKYRMIEANDDDFQEGHTAERPARKRRHQDEQNGESFMPENEYEESEEEESEEEESEEDDIEGYDSEGEEPKEEYFEEGAFEERKFGEEEFDEEDHNEEESNIYYEDQRDVDMGDGEQDIEEDDFDMFEDNPDIKWVPVNGRSANSNNQHAMNLVEGGYTAYGEAQNAYYPNNNPIGIGGNGGNSAGGSSRAYENGRSQYAYGYGREQGASYTDDVLYGSGGNAREGRSNLIEHDTEGSYLDRRGPGSEDIEMRNTDRGGQEAASARDLDVSGHNNAFFGMHDVNENENGSQVEPNANVDPAIGLTSERWINDEEDDEEE